MGYQPHRNNRDAFDHDKGQKSASSGKFLHWNFLIFSSGFLSLSPGLLSNLVRTSPQNVEKFARSPCGGKSSESCHVSGCHVFFSVPKQLQAN